MRSRFISEVRPNANVTKSFERFADMIGYKNSKYKSEYLQLLVAKYSYLHKFQSFSRTSKFWRKHSPSLIQRDKEMRDKLNNELIKRRSIVIKNNSSSIIPISVSSLAAYTFCPASLSISESFETEPTEEEVKSISLRKNKFFDEFLLALINKRGIELLSARMKLNTWDKIINMFTEEGIRYFEINTMTDDRFKAIIIKGTVPEEEYQKYLTRGDYGDLITSRIVFRGVEQGISDPFYSTDKKVCGIPDYVFEKRNGDNFLLLEKHSWSNEPINTPYGNHVIQAAAYLHYLQNFQLTYGYILYLAPNSEARLHKITLDKKLVEKLNRIYEEVRAFKELKQITFEVEQINVKKCFRCSYFAYCDHKSGNFPILNIPYSVK